MNKRIALAASVATTAIAAIGASSASAYTVTGGPNFTGTAGTTTLTDTGTGAALSCTGSTAAGTVNTGTGVGPTLGSITSLGFSNCSGPLGLTFTVAANSLPYSLVATGPTSGGVTPGVVTGVNAQLTGPGCSATVVGSAPASYNNTTRRLTLTGGSGLTVSSVGGSLSCFGLLRAGDSATFSAVYNVVGSPSNPIAINN
jgi:hypothetical protein